MILGQRCSRACTFCNVDSTSPVGVDTDEPQRVAAAVAEIGLDEVVITSVTRDDLPDGGASIWAKTIELIKQAVPGIMVEILIPDFQGNRDNLHTVLSARPHVVGHNLETVRSLYPTVRPQAEYDRSLEVLENISNAGFIAKTSIMIGLGEEPDEVERVIADAADAGCQIFFIGQYLQPSSKHIQVEKYIEPSVFAIYKQKATDEGFEVVMSEPLVRSSFHSDLQTQFVRRIISDGKI